MTKKILVPLDGSHLAEEVLPRAEALAEMENAELVILRVPITPAKAFFGRNTAMASAIISDIEAESELYLEAETRALEKEHVKVTSLMREGPVPETIVEVADEIHADMIAMSTHGRVGMQRWLKGSVADQVVHLTHIPVVLFHPN